MPRVCGGSRASVRIGTFVVSFLFDQNLSPRLVVALTQIFPHSLHVRDLGLASATDDEVWLFAKQNDLTIVSKDSDFHQRSFVFGHPPKVIWIRTGNCSTDDIVGIFHRRHPEIREFLDDQEGSFLALE